MREYPVEAIITLEHPTNSRTVEVRVNALCREYAENYSYSSGAPDPGGIEYSNVTYAIRGNDSDIFREISFEELRNIFGAKHREIVTNALYEAQDYLEEID